ncbi:hypothetical protein LCGC14_0814480 [marine sediment metagenome]|uniref:Zinc/iron-chelating domain-containing protein n=1 Tax=marine sediment metagenome TaxID=412755 RepID=A0A0F9PKN9_9ZZZZ
MDEKENIRNRLINHFEGEMAQVFQKIEDSGATFLNLKVPVGQFQCLKCGWCCRHNLSMEKGISSFDYRGRFVHNPKKSTILTWFEKSIIEKKIKQEYGIVAKIHPSKVFFLRNQPIGFVFLYQLDCRKTGVCSFFNLKKKICNIYKARPLICRMYPLSVQYSILGFPSVNPYCNVIDKMLKEHNPDVDFDSLNLVSINFQQEENTSKNYFKSQFEIVYKYIPRVKGELLALDKTPPLFFNDDELKKISPNKINSYKLYDFSYFVPWCEKNLNTKLDYELFNNYKELKEMSEQMKGFMESMGFEQ